jgi:hypothetical protein
MVLGVEEDGFGVGEGEDEGVVDWGLEDGFADDAGGEAAGGLDVDGVWEGVDCAAHPTAKRVTPKSTIEINFFIFLIFTSSLISCNQLPLHCIL